MEFLNFDEIKEFLEEKYHQYNTPAYIETDPIQVPHNFTKKEDIEIAAFLTSTIAWGQRKTIIKNAWELIRLMSNNPHEFILNASIKDFNHIKNFKHRTFNGDDCITYLKSLQHIYKNYNGIETFFENVDIKDNLNEAIINFRVAFFEIQHMERTQKHFPNILKNSAAKRLHMFLRWMVRKDKVGVDFGIWNSVKPSQLYIPLDVHVGNVARKLGLLKRKQDDWKSVIELTTLLRKFDVSDPVKYDYALFGLGVFERF